MNALIKNLLLAALLASFCISCNKDDDENTPISNSGQMNEIKLAADINIDSVACLVESNDIYTGDGTDGYCFFIGGAPVVNGTFRVNYIPTIEDKYLEPIYNGKSDESWLTGYNYSDNVTLKINEFTDQTAKMSSSVMIDAYRNNTIVGEIVRTNLSLEKMKQEDMDEEFEGAVAAFIIYCNKNVKINATSEVTDYSRTEIITYNMNLHSGWNEINYKFTKVTETTTYATVSSGEEPKGLKWVFIPDDDDYYYGASSKNNSGLKFNHKANLLLQNIFLPGRNAKMGGQSLN